MGDRFTTAQSTVAMRHWAPPAIVTLAAMAALTALSGDAMARQARPAQPTEATAPRDAGEPIMAIVSIKTQQVTFYDADGWILRAPVSTAPRDAKRLPASSPSSRRTRTTTRPSMTMPGCRTCSASPGTASRCTAAAPRICRFARLRADALRLCREAVRQDADRDAGDHLARTTPSPVEFSHPALLVPNAEAVAAAPASVPRRSPARRPRPPRRPTRRRKPPRQRRARRRR